MSNFKLKGPYETNVTIHVTDGNRDGKIEISLTMGELPTQKDIDACIQKATEAAEENGMRLMNKTEFINVMIRERTGSHQRIAAPGGSEWDK